jgi:DNA polymerase-3 subunit psi
MQDPLLDPLRQRILARMGIPLWQQRGRLPGGRHQPRRRRAAGKHARRRGAGPAGDCPLPTGKLWLLAETLPAPSLLGDICRWLGLGTDEVSLLSEMPSCPRGPLRPCSG